MNEEEIVCPVSNRNKYSASELLAFQNMNQYFGEKGNLTKKDIKFMKSMEYDNFNIQIIIRQLLFLSKGRNFVKDLRIMCLLFVCTGTDRVRASSSIKSRSKKRWIAQLFRRYELSRRPANGDAITLGRIAFCFPGIVAQHLDDGRGCIVGDVADDQCPRALRFPSAAALIPNTGPYCIILQQAWKEWFSVFCATETAQSFEWRKLQDRVLEIRIMSEQTRMFQCLTLKTVRKFLATKGDIHLPSKLELINLYCAPKNAQVCEIFNRIRIQRSSKRRMKPSNNQKCDKLQPVRNCQVEIPQESTNQNCHVDQPFSNQQSCSESQPMKTAMAVENLTTINNCPSPPSNENLTRRYHVLQPLVAADDNNYQMPDGSGLPLNQDSESTVFQADKFVPATSQTQPCITEQASELISMPPASSMSPRSAIPATQEDEVLVYLFHPQERTFSGHFFMPRSQNAWSPRLNYVGGRTRQMMYGEPQCASRQPMVNEFEEHSLPMDLSRNDRNSLENGRNDILTIEEAVAISISSSESQKATNAPAAIIEDATILQNYR